MAKSDEQSTLSKIMEAGTKGMASPSPAAKIAGGVIAPTNAGEAAAQGIQMVVNAVITGVKGITEGMIRQHGISPTAKLNNTRFQIEQGMVLQGQGNKGIEAFRQKMADRQLAPNTGKSTNKGIKSFQSKASGQSASGTTKEASSSKGHSKGGQER